MADALATAIKTLSLPDPNEFQFTEENITGLIQEAKTLSDALFADKSRPHDKLEYVRAHFGSLLAHTLLSTWRNQFGLDKEQLHKGMVSVLSVYLLNKHISMPAVMFIKQTLPNVIKPAPEGSVSTHVLDEQALLSFLEKEYLSMMEMAPQEIKEKFSGGFAAHMETEEGKLVYEKVKKYMGLITKIYYFIVPN